MYKRISSRGTNFKSPEDNNKNDMICLFLTFIFTVLFTSELNQKLLAGGIYHLFFHLILC